MSEVKNFDLAYRETLDSFLFEEKENHLIKPHYFVKFYYSSQSNCGIRIVVERHSVFGKMEIVLSTYEDISTAEINNELAISWLEKALKMSNTLKD
jgi:hypothetical protein